MTVDYYNGYEMDDEEAERRQGWASEHGLRLTSMLEAPLKKTVSHRLHRARYWLHGEYLAVSLTHVINPPPGTPSNAPRIHINVTRSFAHGANATTNLSVAAVYDVQSIVAFLCLDEVDPETLVWQDATRYSDIVIVADARAEAVVNGGRLHD